MDEEEYKRKAGVMMMKLDMSKGFDRLEWGFISKVLSSMGFSRQMVNLIGKCISSVSYSVLINGQPSKVFYPERGLRQGDPLLSTCLYCMLMFFQDS